MKSFISSVKYIYTNFLYVMFFVAIPAIFCGFFLDVFKISKFSADYYYTNITSFSDVINKFFNFSFANILNVVFASVLVVIFISAFLGSLEYHFRSGKTSLQNISAYINNNFLVVTVYYLIVLVSFLIYKFILSLGVISFHVVFSGLNSTPTMLNFILTLLLIMGSFIIFSLLLSYFIIALPITLSSGYSVRTSLSDANDLNAKKEWSTISSIIIPSVLVFAFMIIGVVLKVSLLFSFLSVWFLLAYFAVLSYTIYFDYSLIQRYDKKRRYYY